MLMRDKWSTALCRLATTTLLRRRSRTNGMKSKRTYRTVHDLRDIDPTKIAVPDVSSEFATLDASLGTKNARAPGIGVQTPGQTTHE